MENVITTPSKQFMKAYQVAEYLGISVDTVQAMCRNGEIPATKLGRDWYVSKPMLDDHINNLIKQR